MTNSHLLSLLKATDYSPEELGRSIGLSGMTLRRWLKKPAETPIPLVYLPAIRDACYRLVSEGVLDPEIPEIKPILLSGLAPGEHRAAIVNLGLPSDFEVDPTISGDRILTSLVVIGAQAKKQADVEKNPDKLQSFKAMGAEWSERITTLLSVVGSRKLGLTDKFIAYGALFYLLTPIDFIPDTIPFLGFFDDFAILGFAAAYYLKMQEAAKPPSRGSTA
jgi:uncharacterized membrane protein YkvA (DUF1232 family)